MVKIMKIYYNESKKLKLWTLRKNEERVVNASETWSWRRIKRTDRITNDEVFQRVKEERLLLKILNHG